MRHLDSKSHQNICERQFLCDLHAVFYAHLPQEHLFTHTADGFTHFPVMPGKLRNVNVSVDGHSLHRPHSGDLPELISSFAQAYALQQWHGDDRLIAMAASHHRLTWLHPFRDGNGRVARLFSGLYLAVSGINKRNFWSLSRGLSRKKRQYMFELWTTDSPDEEGRHYFNEDLLIDFCDYFLNVCLDQIDFMEKTAAAGPNRVPHRLVCAEPAPAKPSIDSSRCSQAVAGGVHARVGRQGKGA